MTADGACYSGLAFEITFNLNGLNVPDQLIYGIAFNTETRGYAPIGTPGPYNSLNFGLSTVAPTIGTNPLPDTAYVSSGGAFQQATGWTPYSGAMDFESPEPGTAGLILGGGLLLLAGAFRACAGRSRSPR